MTKNSKALDTGIPLKICTTCLLPLPYDEFSFRGTDLKRYPDGFANICKPCMRWYRRRSYARLNDPNYQPPIIRVPLKIHNFSTLVSYIDNDLTKSYSFLAAGINDNTNCKISLCFSTDKWVALIEKDDLVMRDLASYPNIGLEGFLKMIGDQLFQLEIRLDPDPMTQAK